MSATWGRLTTAEQLWWVTVAILATMFAATLVVQLFDKRMLDGASVWAKPLKFEASLALHFATVALVAHFLSPEWRGGTMLLVVAVLSVLSTAVEMGYIIVQAGRQEASHFNLSTPFYAGMYAVMAGGAVVIVAAAGAVGIAAALDGDAIMPPATRLAVVLGLIGGTILTTIVAFTMGGRLNHHVGVEPAGALRMVITGWSLKVGDFRPPHFFATHMIQSVPLGGVLATRVLPTSAAIAAVLMLALMWTALTIGLFRQALSGLPFLPPPGL